MQIELSKVKPSLQPVRTSWDEQKMEELTQSVKKHGLLQAVKVRPVGDEFEVVFGHRRVEACRRLGLTHIEAVMEELDDPTVLVQALIENVVREDLGALDKARGLKALKDVTGWSNKEMARRGIMELTRLGRLLALLEEPKKIQELIGQPGVAIGNHLGSLTESHIREVRAEQLPKEQHIQVLQKAAEEGLTAQQARKEAHDLKTQGTKEEILADAQRYVEQEKQDKEKSRWTYLDDSPCAKNLIRHIKVNKHHWKRAWQDIERGALGIEHMPLIEERLRKYAEFIVALADDLKERREEAVGG